MLKFIKKLIKHSKKEDKSGKILANGLLEIILVKVGILLALAVYGFYVDHQEQKKIRAYFTSIQQEIEPVLKNSAQKLNKTDTLIYKTSEALNFLKTRNKDSVIQLNTYLEPLVLMNNQVYGFPAVTEFINNGYFQKVKNNETVRLLRRLQQQHSDFNRENAYNKERYLVAIEPYVNDHFNYYTISGETTQALLISGGPNGNYENIFDDLELWNLLSQKLHHFQSQKLLQEEFVVLLKDLNTNLNEQLKD